MAYNASHAGRCVVLRMVRALTAGGLMRDLCRRFAAARTEDVAARSFLENRCGLLRRAVAWTHHCRYLRQAHGFARAHAAVPPAWPRATAPPPARLLQDLMFFCAQAKAPQEQAGAV